MLGHCSIVHYKQHLMENQQDKTQTTDHPRRTKKSVADAPTNQGYDARKQADQKQRPER